METYKKIFCEAKGRGVHLKALCEDLKLHIKNKDERDEQERGGSGNLHSGAEWNFCLMAARMAADQKR